MTTQAMYDNGFRCRGKGFNCPGCKDKWNCVEYVNTDVKPKPPLGVMPKHFWDKRRANDLREAIYRYCDAGYEVPFAWVEEYNSLMALYQLQELNDICDNGIKPVI